MAKSKTPNKINDFDKGVITLLIGVVLLIILILNKVVPFSIPIFGKEGDFLGWNWTIYIKRNWFWFTISTLMVVAGIMQIIVFLIKFKNQRPKK